MTIDEKLDKIYELKQMIKLQLLYKGYTETEVGDILDNFPDLIMRLNVSSIDKQPDWFKNSIVCWYDTNRQNITNELLRETPKLNDFSENNFDLILKNFLWNESSGVDSSGALNFSGTEIGIATELPELNDYTVFSKRIWDTGEKLGRIFCSKSDSVGNGAFIIDYFNNNNNITTYSFNSTTSITNIFDPNIIVQSKNKYNDTIINSGTSKDSKKLFIGNIRESDERSFKGKLYKFLLFNRTLTDEEINYVRYVIMGEDFLSWEDGNMITFDDGSPIIF